jgi:hypothetical protein
MRGRINMNFERAINIAIGCMASHMEDEHRGMIVDYERAINIAIGCVMASHMEGKEKREVIETLRELEDKLEEFRDDGWIDE